MSEVTGRCLCGATTYRSEGPGRFSIVCYCTDCQKATGTGHAPQLAVTASTFELTGLVKAYRAKSESGSDLVFQFCETCGSPLAKSTSRAPEIIFVYAGSLDEPQNFANPKPVFESSRQGWDG